MGKKKMIIVYYCREPISIINAYKKRNQQLYFPPWEAGTLWFSDWATQETQFNEHIDECYI